MTNKGFNDFISDMKIEGEFEIINEDFIKNKNYVFYFDYDINGIKEIKILEKADPKTFEIIDKKYVNDKNETIEQKYVKDKNYVYYSNISRHSEGYDYIYRILENADPKTFEIIDKKYIKDKNNVYYKEYEHSYNKYSHSSEYSEHFEILKQIDPETFEVINEEYVKDKNNVFYYRNKYKYECDIDGNSYYREMSNHGYKIIEKVDPETFEVLDERYLKDKKNVYYKYKFINMDDGNFEILEQADTETFEVIDEKYAKDKNNVYYYTEIIKDADPKTFEIKEKDENEISIENIPF